jgi:DNA-binding GntR family transcriptional regulator
MFSLGKITIEDLTEARLSVEPLSVALATERIREYFLEQIKVEYRRDKRMYGER